MRRVLCHKAQNWQRVLARCLSDKIVHFIGEQCQCVEFTGALCYNVRKRNARWMIL